MCNLMLALGLLAGAPSADAILERVDSLRLSQTEMLVRTEISRLAGGALADKKRYDVYVSPGRRSLVLFRSPSEVGRKVLMLDDDFWLLMPTSRRPIRITPAQRLLGEASAGDVATMRWASDYAPSLVAGAVVVDGEPCWKLELTAIRKGTSYQRIELWVARESLVPRAANLYLASGKLAKEARFELGQLGGREQVVAMRLVDRLERDRETVIRYLAMEPRALPDKLYNPAYLARGGDVAP